MNAAIVSIPLIVILTLMAVGHFTADWMASAQQAQACGDERTQERARKVMHDGLDAAFEAHISTLYGNWLRDSGKPDRAALGIHRGVAAYVHGRNAIDAWSLKQC